MNETRLRASHRDAGDQPPVGEHFIPLRKTDLIRMLSEQFDGDSTAGDRFRRLGLLLEAVFHYQYQEVLEGLKACYAPFDPDADTLPLHPPTAAEREDKLIRLFERFESLVERANFVKLSRADVEKVMHLASRWAVRLEVDFDAFERFAVFARGDAVETRTFRRWQKVYRIERADVPVYRRLAVMLKLRPDQRLPGDVDPEKVYLKLFKNIPHTDLEMLLPGSRVKLSLLDGGRIALPTITGVGMTLYKIVQGALIVGVSSVAALLAMIGTAFGLIGYGVKSFFGFLRTKERYQFNLTRNLYYRNIDNNAGVFFRLVNAAEDQEFREAILAYFWLWRCAPPEGLSTHELNRDVEAWLVGKVGYAVDFEVDDAVGKLVRLGIVVQGVDGRLQAIPVDEAMRRLDRYWDGVFDYYRPEPDCDAADPAAS